MTKCLSSMIFLVNVTTRLRYLFSFMSHYIKGNKTFANTIGNISQLRNSNILKGVISDTDQSAYGLLLLS